MSVITGQPTNASHDRSPRLHKIRASPGAVRASASRRLGRRIGSRQETRRGVAFGFESPRLSAFQRALACRSVVASFRQLSPSHRPPTRPRVTPLDGAQLSHAMLTSGSPGWIRPGAFGEEGKTC